MSANYLQGVFKPKNPQKYKGDPTRIIFRSSWELQFCKFLDLNENILEWSSEEIIIPYIYEVDGKQHRYFVDFYVKMRTKNNEIEECLFEIKPSNQVEKPKIKKITPKNQERILTYIKNQNKWEAANNYCKRRGWKFQVLTEKDLGFNGNINNRKKRT